MSSKGFQYPYMNHDIETQVTEKNMIFEKYLCYIYINI